MYAIYHPKNFFRISEVTTIYDNDRVTIFKSSDYPRVDIYRVPDGFCVIYGEIYNGKDVCSRINGWAGTLAASIGMQLLNRNFDLLSELNGSFSVAVYDEKKNTLYIASDRYGSQRFYYGILDGNVHIFPELSCFEEIGYKSVIDLDFLTQFLTFGYIITDKTLIQDVHVMPNGSILEISQTGHQIHQYWDWHFCEENALNDEDIIVEAAGPIWIKAIECRVKGKQKVAIPISGGLDSRAILAATLECKAAEDIVTFTGGTPGTFDYEIGRMVAKAVGVRNFPMDCTLPKDYTMEYRRRCKETDGMVQNITYFFPSDWERISMYTPYVLSGFMGDTLSGSHIYPHMMGKTIQLPTSRAEALDIIFTKQKRLKSEVVANLLNIPMDDYQHRMIGLINTTTRNNLQQWMPNFCNYWDFINRQRNYIIPTLFTQRTQLYYLLPFLDNDLVDFAIMISPDLRLGQRWYRHFLLDRYPLLFKIPVKNLDGRPLRTSPLSQLSENATKFTGKAIASIPGGTAVRIGRYIQDLPKRIRRRHFHPDAAVCRRFMLDVNYADFSLWMRGGNKNWDDIIISSLLKVTNSGLVSKDSVNFYLDSHNKGDDSAINALIILASLGWIIEIFNPRLDIGD